MNFCFRVLTTRVVLVLFALSVLTAFTADAQGTFTLRIRGQDTSGGVDTLLYGRDPRGTYCIDPGVTFYEGTRGFTEFELPPAPPGGVFDLRFSNQRPGLGGCTAATERGNGLRYDFRGQSGSSQIDTFQVKFQIGTAGPISLFWQDGLGVFCDSMRLKDLFGGFLVNLNMLATQTLVVPNPAITQLNIIMYRAPGLILIAPSDGVTTPTTLNFSWNSNEDATKYRIQVATDSLFSNLVVHDSTVATTSRLVSGLSGGTIFYWRIAAGNDLGWGAYSVRRSFTTEGSGNPPPTPGLLSPPDGALDQPTSINFVWNAASDAADYHIQVATDSLFSSGVIVNDSTLTDTSRTVSGLVYSTAYYWRVRARNAAGSSAFSALRSFTTQALPVPPAPSLASPADAATGQPTTITFRWLRASNAANYRIQVATDSSFASGMVVDDSTLTDTLRLVSGLSFGTTHFWRVKASNTSGGSAYSGTRSFTTQVEPPPAPLLSTPTNGQTGLALPVDFTWTIGSGTVSFYRLRIGTDSTFATGVVFDDSLIAGTSRSVGTLATGTKYYWKVVARNAGGSGPASETWNFTTLTLPPPVPVLVSPANGASNQPTTITFKWLVSSNTVNYRLQVGTDSSFASGMVVDDSTLTDTSRVVSNLSFGTAHFWRVKASNTAGGSAYSGTRSFTTQVEPPPAPLLSTPTNGQTGLALPVDFTWTIGSGTVSFYRLRIGTDSTFVTGVVFDDSLIAGTSRSVNSLATGTKYYWKVVARNAGGSGPASATWNFTTLAIPPPVPTLVSPANGVLNQPTSITFLWSASAGALNYRLQVATDSNFTTGFIFNDSTLTDTSRLVSALALNTKYYWHVSARNAAGNSAFSSRRSFTTQSVAPPSGPPPDHFTLRFIGTDGGGGKDTLRYGRDPRATYCIDPGVTFYEGTTGFTEFELPPAPPAGVFDLRVVNHRPGLGGCIAATERGNGLRYDIRALTGESQIDTFQLKFQTGISGPMNLSWQEGLGVFCDSIRLKDLFGGFLVNVNMRTTQSTVITNPAITGLNILMYRAPGVLLIAPSNGNTVPPTLNLSWNSNEDATQYRVQVATDSLFANLIVHDSTVTGTSRLVSGLSSPGTYYWRISAGNDYGWGAFSQRRVFFTGSVPAAPALVSPADGATNQPTSVTFTWNRSTGATLYHLQIASDSNFTSGFVTNDSTITDSLLAVSNLAFSSTYYWRVGARNGVGGGPFSSRRSFSTQLQPPPAPVLTSPANGQTGVATTVTFTWTGGVGGSLTYRLQLGTDSTFASGVFLDDSTITTTSRLVASLLNNTTYYWRVRGKNTAGYGQPSQIFGFTTAIAAPIAPGLVAPIDGATNVSQSPTLVWNAAATATSYRLQVARDTAFAQIAFDDSAIAATSRQIGPLLSNTNYFWRVRGKNAGGSGAYSVRFRFLTTAAPPVPLQVMPLDSATRISRTPTFVWNRVPGATAYFLQVASDAGFTTLLYSDSTITDSARTAGPFPYGALLRWRLRSKNTAGISAFSAPRIFTVMLQPPATPALLSPANNAVNQPVTPTLRWQSTSLASGYDLQIALDTLMTNVVINDTSVTDSVRVVRIAPSTAYYWRVRGRNTEGTYGAYSVVRRFSTANVAPAVPIPFYPSNADTGVSRTPTLRWVTSPGALYYRVQVARDNLFSQIVADDSLIADDWFEPGLLLANTQYYWRVRARGTSGWSSYSIIQHFMTGTLIVSVGDPDPEQPEEFVLYQNYPNPFNPSTTIPYAIQTEAFVALKVYNLLGEEIAVLASGHHSRGSYQVVWDGRSSDGRTLSSGLYLVRMVASSDRGDTFSSVIKIVFMK